MLLGKFRIKAVNFAHHPSQENIYETEDRWDGFLEKVDSPSGIFP